MAYRTLQGHVHQSHREGVPLCLTWIVISHVGKALVQAGLQGETKGVCQ